MKTKYFNGRIRAWSVGSRARATLSKTGLGALLVGGVLGVATPAPASSSGTSNCGGSYDPTASYPPLPESRGADVSGEAGVEFFLHEDRAVVDLDGCFYLVDRPVEIDHAELDSVTLLFEMPDHTAGASVYVTEDASWIDTLETSEPRAEYVLPADYNRGFEVSAPDQSAPTVPIVVAQPSGGNPPPD